MGIRNVGGEFKMSDKITIIFCLMTVLVFILFVGGFIYTTGMFNTQICYESIAEHYCNTAKSYQMKFISAGDNVFTCKDTSNERYGGLDTTNEYHFTSSEKEFCSTRWFE